MSGGEPLRGASASSGTESNGLDAWLRRVALGENEAFDQVYPEVAGPVYGLALLVAGLGWRTIDQQHQINSLNAQSTTISQLLAAPDAYSARVPVSGGGSVLLVDSRSRNRAAVSFSGLSQAPAGKTYQLWLMAPDGTARSEGLMQAAPNRPVVIDGLTGESKVGMTIEPAGGSAQPTTVPVMVAALGA